MDASGISGALSVGVRMLDCDHREQSEAINEILAAVSRDEDRGRTGLLLRKLVRFTDAHFALEEGMMAATRYPEIAQHHLDHQRLSRRVKALASSYNRAGSILDRDGLSCLSNLHVNHVAGEDLNYGLWLNGVGNH